MTCLHYRLHCVSVFVAPLKLGQPRQAIISIACEDCSILFRFTDGPESLCFSDDRTNLSAWIVEKDVR
jgi:hypothetical protein